MTINPPGEYETRQRRIQSLSDDPIVERRGIMTEIRERFVTSQTAPPPTATAMLLSALNSVGNADFTSGK